MFDIGNIFAFPGNIFHLFLADIAAPRITIQAQVPLLIIIISVVEALILFLFTKAKFAYLIIIAILANLISAFLPIFLGLFWPIFSFSGSGYFPLNQYYILANLAFLFLDFLGSLVIEFPIFWFFLSRLKTEAGGSRKYQRGKKNGSRKYVNSYDYITTYIGR